MSNRFIVLIIIFAGLITACTTDVTIDIPIQSDVLVVEGIIENELPPYILLTKSVAIFGGNSLNDLEDLYVHNAIVTVESEGQLVTLPEICITDLPIPIQQQVAANLGFNFNDSTEIPNICIYTDPNYFLTGNATLLGEEERDYHLTIQAEGKTLTATTRVPKVIGYNFLSYENHPNPNNDSMLVVTCNLTIPDTFGNHVRYFTKRNNEPLYPPLSSSVWDDKLFIGTTIELPIERGQNPQDDLDFATYSFFWKGDTVVLKWCDISKPHFDFWRTLESDGGDSPFSTPVIKKSNIVGDGVGVWGGYAATYDTIILPL